VPDLIGKFEIIGEWASDGSLEESEDRVVLTVKELKDTIKKRVYELDLQILLAGLITILGIHQENGSKRFFLEVHVPLFLGEEMEYDVDMLYRRAAALESLQDRGYYLKGNPEGYVTCFIEGPLDDLFDEIGFVEGVLTAGD
jgi:hypothetical protein